VNALREPMFHVLKEPEDASPWALIHTPSGAYACAFSYRTHALACAAAFNALAATVDLTTAEACVAHANQLIRVRRPFVEADMAQWAARRAKKQ